METAKAEKTVNLRLIVSVPFTSINARVCLTKFLKGDVPLNHTIYVLYHTTILYYCEYVHCAAERIKQLITSLLTLSEQLNKHNFFTGETSIYHQENVIFVTSDLNKLL